MTPSLERHWLTPELKAQMDAEDAHRARKAHLEELSAALRRCPFCGGEAFLDDNGGDIVAECDNCGIRTGIPTQEPELAVATWNQVPRSSPLVNAVHAFLATNDEETGTIDTSPVPSCPQCTHGTVPNTLNKGLCVLHALTALIQPAKA